MRRALMRVRIAQSSPSPYGTTPSESEPSSHRVSCVEEDQRRDHRCFSKSPCKGPCELQRPFCYLCKIVDSYSPLPTSTTVELRSLSDCIPSHQRAFVLKASVQSYSICSISRKPSRYAPFLRAIQVAIAYDPLRNPRVSANQHNHMVIAGGHSHSG